ncbi:MAG TPA: hypothetical protein VNE40_00945 [Candidatus Dormibacteraeota bacterium]|nr:hypothetical protein [Candidatus Dormibacteraeota bacterium]
MEDDGAVDGGGIDDEGGAVDGASNGIADGGGAAGAGGKDMAEQLKPVVFLFIVLKLLLA